MLVTMRLSSVRDRNCKRRRQRQFPSTNCLPTFKSQTQETAHKKTAIRFLLMAAIKLRDASFKTDFKNPLNAICQKLAAQQTGNAKQAGRDQHHAAGFRCRHYAASKTDKFLWSMARTA